MFLGMTIFFITVFLLSLTKVSFIVAFAINMLFLPLYLHIDYEIYHIKGIPGSLDIIFRKDIEKEEIKSFIVTLFLHILYTLFAMVTIGIIYYLITFKVTPIFVYVIASVIFNLCILVIQNIQNKII